MSTSLTCLQAMAMAHTGLPGVAERSHKLSQGLWNLVKPNKTHVQLTSTPISRPNTPNLEPQPHIHVTHRKPQAHHTHSPTHQNTLSSTLATLQF